MTGTIDTFVLSGKQENSWSVALDGASPTSNGAGEPTSVYWSGTASGGGAAGTFGVNSFFGPASALPSMITGEFRAYFTDGTAIGAFSGKNDSLP